MSGFRTAATTSPLPVIANLFAAAVAVSPGGPERSGGAAQRLDSEYAQLSTLAEQQIDNRSWDIALTRIFHEDPDGPRSMLVGAKKPRADEGSTPEGRGPGWP